MGKRSYSHIRTAVTYMHVLYVYCTYMHMYSMIIYTPLEQEHVRSIEIPLAPTLCTLPHSTQQNTALHTVVEFGGSVYVPATISGRVN